MHVVEYFFYPLVLLLVMLNEARNTTVCPPIKLLEGLVLSKDYMNVLSSPELKKN